MPPSELLSYCTNPVSFSLAFTFGMLSSVFVYGTLMSPEVLRILIGRIPKMVVPAVARGHVRHPVLQHVFPGMISSQQQQQQTEGVVLVDLTVTEMQVLDWFEGEEYVRRTITVECQCSVKREVETYLWNNPVSELAVDQEWDYQHFRKTDLDWYLANSVRPSRLEMDELGVGKKID